FAGSMALSRHEKDIYHQVRKGFMKFRYLLILNFGRVVRSDFDSSHHAIVSARRKERESRVTHGVTGSHAVVLSHVLPLVLSAPFAPSFSLVRPAFMRNDMLAHERAGLASRSWIDIAGTIVDWFDGVAPAISLLPYPSAIKLPEDSIPSVVDVEDFAEKVIKASNLMLMVEPVRSEEI
ncbi:hypothetical protein BT69DRAFT_1306829, partial [Atractiella rhizophila]